MKMNLKKGFTLIELLAVIVVLGIIMLIATTAVSSVMQKSKKDAFKSNARILLKNIDYNDYLNPTDSITSIDESNIASKLGIPSDNYSNIELSLDGNNKPYIVLEGNGKWDNLIAYGTYDNIQVVSSTEYAAVQLALVYDTTKAVNKPQLVTGMTPVKWNGSSWVNTTESDSAWYSYDTTNKNWANAKTADGSMWVWIPRYIYKINPGWHSSTTGTISIQFSKGTNDNWNSASIGNIDTGTTSPASNNKWTNHPAFTFGTTEVTGFWVAKFEVTAVEGVAEAYASDNVTTKTIKIIPNAIPWKYIQISNAFDNCRSMETKSTYGWGTSGSGIDTHLIKNTEWGAVSYLSKSTYGKGTTEVWINNTLYTAVSTGCAGDSAAAAPVTTCGYAYNTANGMGASTSGTIYGVYDMSGGATEYVSAYVNNGDFSVDYNGHSIVIANTKYKDVYTKASTENSDNNYLLAINSKGDAIYETSNAIGRYAWFSDLSSMPYSYSPFISRGDTFNSTSDAGIFEFGEDNGGGASNTTFRPVLMVKAGL